MNVDDLSDDGSTPAQNQKGRKNASKRRKVSQACVYCRRSHMTCDEGRPCQRCIKRKIAHLCHDEPKPSTPSSNKSTATPSMSNATSGITTPALPMAASEDSTLTTTVDGLTLANYASAFPPLFASAHPAHEFTILSDFLSSIGDDSSFHTTHALAAAAQLNPELAMAATARLINSFSTVTQPEAQPQDSSAAQLLALQQTTPSAVDDSRLSSTEKFILTAADPGDGPYEDRLMQVINAKFDAGLLKPYNYIKSYTRLQKWMEGHMNPTSTKRILTVMGTFRPRFRRVAQSLTDIDLVLVEEAFERLLLEYDRVFSSMGIPACLWRRTGEIWKSNKEFANLVGVGIDRLREGRTCIYELMTEDSAVNYWEKYGNIAFDAGQKAVLTSCFLHKNSSTESSVVNCCFSFTIRRDKYNIPLLIAGNFLPISPEEGRTKELGGGSKQTNGKPSNAESHAGSA
ncbi:hypothetical protein BJ742DRAFT_783370 [Cladochytrium replicatum]|nr:hypothetical protein BJ742DRAFT_783370 [Cladochytrium replicatum]